MGFLTPAQTAAIKQIRQMAWNRPFTVQRSVLVTAQDFYDDATSAPTTIATLQGDWAWLPLEQRRDSPGGAMTESDLALACDINHQAVLMQSGVRLLVEGVLCAIDRITPAPESGELVIHASRL